MFTIEKSRYGFTATKKVTDLDRKMYFFSHGPTSVILNSEPCHWPYKDQLILRLKQSNLEFIDESLIWRQPEPSEKWWETDVDRLKINDCKVSMIMPFGLYVVFYLVGDMEQLRPHSIRKINVSAVKIGE